MNDNNFKCSEYGSIDEESSSREGALGLPKWNVEAHVVSCGPPRGSEYQDISRGNWVKVNYL